MSRALQLGTRKADGNNIPFDLPLSTQNGGTGSTTGVSRASLGLATTDTVVFGALQPTTPLAAIYGGTGFSSFTIGAVPYGKTPTTIDWVLPNTTTTPNYYTSTGTGAAGQTPAWKTPTQVKTDLSLNNVENTALSTWAGSTNVTTLGTVATGTWSATAIGPTKGGTNQTSYATGDTLYASASNTLSKLSGNTTSTVNYLSQTGNGSTSAAPVWKTPSQIRTDLSLSTSSNVQFNSVIAGTYTRLNLSSFVAKKNANQSLSSGVDTKVKWDVGVSGNSSIWAVGNPSKFNAIASGYWLLAAQIEFQPSTASRNYVNIYVNGTSQGYNRDSIPSTTLYTSVNICTILPLTNGDYVEVSACSNGAAGTVDANQNYCSFSLVENA